MSHTVGKLLLAVLVVTLFLVPSGRAQSESWGGSDVYYDSTQGMIWGSGDTLVNYSTAEYYTVQVATALIRNGVVIWSNGNTSSWGSANVYTYARAWVDTPYRTYSSHTLNAYYELDNCHYDPWGWSLVSICPDGVDCTSAYDLTLTEWDALCLDIQSYMVASTSNTLTTPAGTLTCTPSSVTRGSSVTCTASGVSMYQVQGWTFEGGDVTVDDPTVVASWSGIMAVGGTVTVHFLGSGKDKSVTVSVTPRTGWQTSAVSPQSVANGTFVTLPTPPAGQDGDLGYSNYTYSFTVPAPAQIPAGPNKNVAYYAANVTTGEQYRYEINPDLANNQSAFSTHQWGNCGYISWSNLLNNVTQHESGSSPALSHYSEYVTSLGSNNPGTYVESRVAAPDADLDGFQEATIGDVRTRLQAIDAAAVVEPPYGPNKNQITGEFQGYINYAPYATCP